MHLPCHMNGNCGHMLPPASLSLTSQVGRAGKAAARRPWDGVAFGL